ncbi:hypothetical protein AcW1_003446 [Taiwanofungus camphoratus]|nr:hypothetical protein AcV5_002093 [Antrodia cinnamomea]KAI0941593.1 hypothetical protein AcW1_003446 [Antrodia cinnamomea]
MASETSVPVLVAGAGPSGLVLALTLLKNGISVRIIEKKQTFHVGSRGAGITARAQEVYKYLNVLPDILSTKPLSLPARVYKLPGGVEPIKTFYMDPPVDPTPSAPYTNYITLGQDRSEAILRSHLAKYDCCVELGTELVSFEQHVDHVKADVIRRNGDEEYRETVISRWLVGADGARGIVRKQLGLSFLGETLGDDQRFVIGDLEVQGLDRNYWHSWGDMSTKMVMLRPTDSYGVFALFSGGRVDHKKIATNREELVKFIRDGTDRDDLVVGKVIWLSEYRPNIRMVDKFGEGRVFVVGDAAHVHTPFGAQGMTSGIQDSFNLGWKLALVERGMAPPSLLSTYSEERLPVIAEVLKKSTSILKQTAVAKGDGTNSSAWYRGGPLQQLGVNYRWSSIVIDERMSYHRTRQPLDPYGMELGDTVRAGDRAPNAPGLVDMNVGDSTSDGDKSASLFDIFGPSYHTVLLFTTDVEQLGPVVEVLKGYPPHIICPVAILPQGTAYYPAIHENYRLLVDRDGHAYASYAIPKDHWTMVIVRPDGVVGGITYGEAGLRRYFEGILSINTV